MIKKSILKLKLNQSNNQIKKMRKKNIYPTSLSVSWFILKEQYFPDMQI